MWGPSDTFHDSSKVSPSTLHPPPPPLPRDHFSAECYLNAIRWHNRLYIKLLVINCLSASNNIPNFYQIWQTLLRNQWRHALLTIWANKNKTNSIWKSLRGSTKVSQFFEILLQTFFMIFQILTKREIFMVHIKKFIRKVWRGHYFPFPCSQQLYWWAKESGVSRGDTNRGILNFDFSLERIGDYYFRVSDCG